MWRLALSDRCIIPANDIFNELTVDRVGVGRNRRNGLRLQCGLSCLSTHRAGLLPVPHNRRGELNHVVG